MEHLPSVFSLPPLRFPTIELVYMCVNSTYTYMYMQGFFGGIFGKGGKCKIGAEEGGLRFQGGAISFQGGPPKRNPDMYTCTPLFYTHAEAISAEIGEWVEMVISITANNVA